MSKFEVIVVPSFLKEIDEIKDRKQLELVYKAIEKIERMGSNALKILHIRKHYLLGEIKFMHPPYRLYAIVDQSIEKFYIVKWEHKENQEKVIGQLKEKLQFALETGIKNIVGLFSK